MVQVLVIMLEYIKAAAWTYSTVFLFIAVFIFVHQRQKELFFKNVGVECEPTWPIFGAFPTIFQKGILEHDAYSIGKYGAIHGSYLGNIPTLVVAEPLFIKEIFVRQFHKFPYRMQALYVSKWWENGVVLASGRHWRYLRSLISPSFSTGKLREMRPRLLKCLNTMIEYLRERTAESNTTELDIRKILGALTMDIICCTSFGKEMETLKNLENDFTRHAKIVSTLNIESNPVNALPLIVPGIRRVFEYLDLDYVDKTSLDYIKAAVGEMIAYRKTQPETDFKDTLYSLMNAHENKKIDNEKSNNNASKIKDKSMRQYENISTNSKLFPSDECKNALNEYKQLKEKGLNDDELMANALITLMAGYDTTATTLTWMCFLLANNLHIQQTLINEIDAIVGMEEPDYEVVMKLEYLDWFLCETLRLYPAANRTGRDACVETSVCGCKIPKGLSVTVPIYAMHRMPEYWSEPEKCIPERFSPENRHKINPFVYIPFGVGPRACVGMRMAKMMCKIILVKFLQHFKVELNKLTENPPVLEKSILTKPANGMFLSVISRGT